MSAEFGHRWTWQLDADAERDLRMGLPQLAAELRGELWWWMSQRGKGTAAMPPDAVADLDPGGDRIVDYIREQETPGYARADWALATYALLTKFDHPQELLYASNTGSPSPSADLAFRDIRLPEAWPSTLVGGAVHAQGVARRLP